MRFGAKPTRPAVALVVLLLVNVAVKPAFLDVRMQDGHLYGNLVDIARNGAPVLLVTGFADSDTAVGVDPDGAVHVSRDAGVTWEEAGGQTAQPAAVAAEVVDGDLRIWVATEEGIEFSEDGGASFSTTIPVTE